MTGELKPYLEHQASGSRLLGDVPVHWRVGKLRGLVRPRNERNRTDLPLLSVARERGVFVRQGSGEENHNVIPEDLSNYKVAHRGDLVINKMKAWQGSMGIAPCDGIVSPAYFVFRLAVEDVRYGQALLRSRPYVGMFAAASDGVRVGQWDLSIDGMKEIPVLLPPLEEQAAIVRFLDHVGGRIERAIWAKRKVIALLQEQKQAIIHRAVARGLDSSVASQNASAPWIGKVPQHWRITRVKNEFACLNTKRVALSSVDRGRMTSREFDYYGASGVIDRVDDYKFDDDLLLIAEDGANLVLRNLPLAIVARGRFWVNNHAHVLRPRHGSLMYLQAMLESLSYRPWITGAAQPKLTKDRLLSIAIAVPPRVEQEAIVSWFQREVAPLERSIASMRRETDLLREYRTRLTADVVTGKLDVREAAAKLPDEPRDTDLQTPDPTEDPIDEEAVVE